MNWVRQARCLGLVTFRWQFLHLTKPLIKASFEAVFFQAIFKHPIGMKETDLWAFSEKLSAIQSAVTRRFYLIYFVV